MQDNKREMGFYLDNCLNNMEKRRNYENARTMRKQWNTFNNLLQRKRYSPNVGDIKIRGIFHYTEAQRRIGIKRIYSDSGKSFKSIL